MNDETGLSDSQLSAAIKAHSPKLFAEWNGLPARKRMRVRFRALSDGWTYLKNCEKAGVQPNLESMQRHIESELKIGFETILLMVLIAVAKQVAIWLWNRWERRNEGLGCEND